jgi:threonine efflux protein
MLMLFLTVALVHIIALMSPGPDFFFVSQTAVSRSRKEAMMGVLGITCGDGLGGRRAAWPAPDYRENGLAAYHYYGRRRLIPVLDGLSDAARCAEEKRCAGGGAAGRAGPQRRSFLKGLLTNLANPKAIIYFGSVFSLFVGDSVGTGERWGFPADRSGNAGLVYRRGQPVRLTGHAPWLPADGKWIDGIAGTLFAGFGIHLIISR